ncbi:TetR/AcrR family transcriptional regulator, partial [Pseudomonas sp. 3A(2025)]
MPDSRAAPHEPPRQTRKPRATRAMLVTEGVDSLSIYSVAERADIPPSSVYHFFANVPALLEA